LGPDANPLRLEYLGFRDVPSPDSSVGLITRNYKLKSLDMVDKSLSEPAREAVLKAIIKSAPTVGNSPAGIRDLAEAYALLERELVPNAGVVQNRT